MVENIKCEEWTWLVKRSLEIQISNNTRSFTLKNSMTFFNCGICSKPPNPLLPPGSTDSCNFLGNFPFWGISGVLAFEAESFTLAIYFSNPIDYNSYSMELGLELSLSKAHLEGLEDTYARMAEGKPPPAAISAHQRVVLTTSHGSVAVSAGPITAMATMSNCRSSVIRMVLTEEK